MKKSRFIRLVAALLCFAALFALCACGVQGKAEDARVFVDSTGREIALPEEISRIAVTGIGSQLVVFALAPEMFVALTSPWDAGAEEYIDEKYLNLPVLGQLYGGKGEWNAESLMVADPQLVIDVGESKDGIAEDMDALSEQTGIPFVHISATTATMGDTYRKLGELLGKPEEAAVLADFCDKHYADANAFVETVDKLSVLYCLGDAGTNVIAKDSYHSEVIDLIGDNSAVLENPSSKGLGNETDMEQLLLWNPEVIVFAPGSVYDSVGSDPLWQQMDAIRNGNYYQVPDAPVNWFGFPPSVQRYLGMIWLSALLYPDAIDFDPMEEIQSYFRLFYHTELTEEQFHNITHGLFAA